MDYLGFPLHTIAVFTIFVIIALCIDFLGHKDKTTNLKSASIWSIFWVFISILFGLFVYYEHAKKWLLYFSQAIS